MSEELDTQAGLSSALDGMYRELLEGRYPEDGHLDAVLAVLRQKSVIIYGAGRGGRTLAALLADFGVPLLCLVDRNWDAIREVNGIEVCSPESLAQADQDACLVVLGTSQVELLPLLAADLDRINPALTRVSGLSLVYLLRARRCRDRSRDGGKPSLRDCISYHVRPYKCPMFCRRVEEMNGGDGTGIVRRASLNDVGYMLGEVCTLRCEHCNEGIPYLSSRHQLSSETVLRDIRALTQACTFLHRLALVGGEPFAHPDILPIINGIAAMPGIGYIGVFTNGTLVPSPDLCAALRHERIVVTVTDYSRNENLSSVQATAIRRTIDALNASDVTFTVVHNSYWFDLNGFEEGTISPDDLRKCFSQCCMAACHRVYDGVLYHCPYQVTGIKRGKLQKRDCLEIHKHTPQELVAELNRFEQIPFIDACRYCNLPKGPRDVVAGLQLRGNLE